MLEVFTNTICTVGVPYTAVLVFWEPCGRLCHGY